MIDMLKTIAPKSDQLNADDLLGGQSKTITITRVSIAAGDQPVTLSYEGDGGKPYKPCKSMRRVLVQVWGSDGNQYIGRSLTLFRDDSVKFGGQDVGGIRISHMSHIEKAITMALTNAKASRKPFTVKPLAVEVTLDDMLREIATAKTLEDLKNIVNKASKAFAHADSRAEITAAKDKRKAELTANPMDEVK